MARNLPSESVSAGGDKGNTRPNPSESITEAVRGAGSKATAAPPSLVRAVRQESLSPMPAATLRRRARLPGQAAVLPSLAGAALACSVLAVRRCALYADARGRCASLACFSVVSACLCRRARALGSCALAQLRPLRGGPRCFLSARRRSVALPLPRYAPPRSIVGVLSGSASPPLVRGSPPASRCFVLPRSGRGPRPVLLALGPLPLGLALARAQGGLAARLADEGILPTPLRCAPLGAGLRSSAPALPRGLAAPCARPLRRAPPSAGESGSMTTRGRYTKRRQPSRVPFGASRP